MPVDVPHHPGHPGGVKVDELTRKALRNMINRGTRDPSVSLETVGTQWLTLITNLLDEVPVTHP